MLHIVRKLRPLISLRTEYKMRRAIYSLCPCSEDPQYSVFHACIWKTGSQWIRLVLSDPRFYIATGLKPMVIHHPPSLEADPESFCIPPGYVVTNLFVYWTSYHAMAKPTDSRVFYVLRDPRNLFVSWYFSARYSHRSNPQINKLRKLMAGKDDLDGMKILIDYFDWVQSRMESWLDAADRDPQIVLVRFEDLVGPNRIDHWCTLLERLKLSTLSRNRLSSILDFYSIERLSGSNKSKKSIKSLYGKQGNTSWSDFMDKHLYQAFMDKFGELVERSGYL